MKFSLPILSVLFSRLLPIAILFLLVSTSAFGQLPEERIPIEPPLNNENSTDDGLGITEFIFNETITKLGADFYHYFFQNWVNTSTTEGLSIYVLERPIPGMGGIISVKIEEQIVYQGMLRPNNQQIRDAAAAAVERAQSYMINYEVIQQQLESDDQRGSGIF